jgi:hypothetical protein
MWFIHFSDNFWINFLKIEFLLLDRKFPAILFSYRLKRSLALFRLYMVEVSIKLEIGVSDFPYE